MTKSKIEVEDKKVTVAIPSGASRKRRTSALSLKNIHAKLTDVDFVATDEDLSSKPKTPFTESTLIEKWSAFGKALELDGELNRASIVNTSQPILKNGKIMFPLPSKIMEDQFGNIKGKLLNYLRVELNNYGIQIETVLLVDDKKKYVYTPQDKFNKLVDSNPDVMLLKNTFGLDI